MTPTLLTGLLIGVGLPAILAILIGIFAKVFPKEETFAKRLAPIAEGAAIAWHALLGRWLKPAEEAQIEEGVCVTLAYWLDGMIHVFMAKWSELVKK